VAALIAAVVLAAGESARLGQPKQLIGWQGQSLVRHAVECAADGGCEPVFVVLGAHAEKLRFELSATSARPVPNPRWQEGLGSSVSAGVRAVEEQSPEASAVVLLVCDQPRITPGLIRRLCRRRAEAGARLVACAYAGTVGVPALFDRDFFPDLAGLSGPVGARSLLRRHADEVLQIPWPEGALDLDLPEDLP
jgi:molybdenum cofactor cytidylyltransferase